MSNALTYDLMLETRGILRSSDVRVRLDREALAQSLAGRAPPIRTSATSKRFSVIG